MGTTSVGRLGEICREPLGIQCSLQYQNDDLVQYNLFHRCTVVNQTENGQDKRNSRSTINIVGTPKHIIISKIIRRRLSALSNRTLREDDTISRCLQMQRLARGRAKEAPTTTLVAVIWGGTPWSVTIGLKSLSGKCRLTYIAPYMGNYINIISPKDRVDTEYDINGE